MTPGYPGFLLFRTPGVNHEKTRFCSVAPPCRPWPRVAPRRHRVSAWLLPGPYARRFKRGVQPALEAAGVEVQATEFSNIIQINTALMDGSLNTNVFQTAFLDTFNAQQKGDLVEVLQDPALRWACIRRSTKT